MRRDTNQDSEFGAGSREVSVSIEARVNTSTTEEVDPNYSLHNYSFCELERDYRLTKLGPWIRDREEDNINPFSLAFGFLSVSHPVRRLLIRVCDHRWFDRTVLLLIVVNSVTLALGDPSLEDNQGVTDFLFVCEWIFQVAFTLEAAIKIGARGFAGHSGAYLRQSWRVLDFVIVVVGWVSAVTPAGGNVGAVKVLRAFRIVRPLRSISRIKKMQELMATLMNSLPLVLNVFVLLLFVVWISSILGILLFAGALHHRCYIPAGTVVPGTFDPSQDRCIGGVGSLMDPVQTSYTKEALAGETVLESRWLVCNSSQWPCGTGFGCSTNGVALEQECVSDREKFNYGWLSFDNIFSAALLVLRMTSLDDWPEFMVSMQRRTGHHAWLYFFLVTLVLQHFVFSLVLAVLTKAFSDERDKCGTATALRGPRVRGITCANVSGAAVAHPLLVVCQRIFVDDRRLASCIVEDGVQFWTSRPPGADEVPDMRCEMDDVIEVIDERDGWIQGWVARVGRPFGTKGHWLPLVRDGVQCFRFLVAESEDESQFQSEPGCDDEIRAAFGFTCSSAAFGRSRRLSVQDELMRAKRRVSALMGPAEPRKSWRDTSRPRRSRVSVAADMQPRPKAAQSRPSFAPRSPLLLARGSVNPSFFLSASRRGSGSGGKLHTPPHSSLQVPGRMLHGSPSKSTVATGHGNSSKGESKGEGKDAGHDGEDDAVEAPDKRISIDFNQDASGVPVSRQPTGTLTPASPIRPPRRRRRRTDALLQAIGELNGQPDEDSHLNAPGAKWRQAIRKIAQHPLFGSFFLFATVVNVSALAMLQYPPHRPTEDAIDTVNLLCSLLFIIECIIKWTGLGSTYFRDNYNVFDFVLVLFSLPAIAGRGATGLNALRALRLNRVFRLFRVFTQLRNLVTSLILSIRDVLWLSLLILLYIFIYGVLGMQLFQRPPRSAAIRHLGFTSFGEACLTVFVLMTGEGWGAVMKEAMEEYSPLACVFFVTNFLIGHCVLLSLFVAILIDNFTRVTRVLKEEQADREVEQMEEKQREQDAMQQNLTLLLSGGRGAATVAAAVLRQDTSEGDVDVSTDAPPQSSLHQATAALLAAPAPPPPPATTAFKGLDESTVSEEEDPQSMIMDLQFATTGVVMPGRGRQNKAPTRRKGAGERLHGRSMGCFGPHNRVRQAVARLVSHPAFEHGVTVLVVVNAVLIALDSPDLEEHDELQTIITVSDKIFAVVFVIECMLKIVARGFYFTPNAYARDNWNCVDLVSTLLAVAGVFEPSMKPLRVMRTLRLVVRLKEVRLIVECLMAVIPSVTNVCLLMLSFISVWAILGVHLFNGYQWGCTDVRVPPLTYQECVGNETMLVQYRSKTAFGVLVEERVGTRDWRPFTRYTFDHVGKATFTLFVMAVGDSWQSVMYEVMDSGGREEPKEYNRRWWVCLYFVVFIVVGQFFFMNLFVGLLLETLVTVKDKKHKEMSMLSPLQDLWLGAQKIAVKPLDVVPPEPGHPLRKLCWRITMGKWPLKVEVHLVDSGRETRITSHIALGENSSARGWHDSQDRLTELPVCVADGTLACLPESLDPGMEIRVTTNTACSVYIAVDPRNDGGLCSALPENNWVDNSDAPLLAGAYDYKRDLMRKMRMFASAVKPRKTLHLPHLSGRAGNVSVIVVPASGQTNPFDLVISAMILLNAAVLSMTHYSQPDELTRALWVLNFLFVTVFAVEAAIKIVGTGTRYWSDSWNRFDFFLVFVSLFSFAPAVDTGGATVVRLFRIGRLLRLLKRAQGLRTLFQALVSSLPNLAHVVVFLLILFFMFSAVGVDLFGKVRRDIVMSPQGLDEFLNFRNVYYAFVTLYTLSTTEGWLRVMEATSLSPPRCDPELGDCGPDTAVSGLYFTVFIIIGGFLTVNLFVTVVVQGFYDTTEARDQQDVLRGLQQFTAAWQRVDTLGKGAVEARLLMGLLTKLQEPLWRPHSTLTNEITEFGHNLNQLGKLCLPLDEKLRVHYSDAVSALSLRLYGLDNQSGVAASQYGPWRLRTGCWEMVHWFACKKICVGWKKRKTDRLMIFAVGHAHDLPRDGSVASGERGDDDDSDEAAQPVIQCSTATPQQERQVFAAAPEADLQTGAGSEARLLGSGLELPSKTAQTQTEGVEEAPLPPHSVPEGPEHSDSTPPTPTSDAPPTPPLPPDPPPLPSSGRLSACSGTRA